MTDGCDISRPNPDSRSSVHQRGLKGARLTSWAGRQRQMVVDLARAVTDVAGLELVIERRAPRGDWVKAVKGESPLDPAGE